MAYVCLERSCASITWCRPSWSSLKTGGGGSGSSAPDYSLATNPEDTVSPGLVAQLSSTEPAGDGFLELAAVKEISLGGRDRERDPELSAACRRYGLDKFPAGDCCLSLVYGTNLSDNRVLFLLMPPNICK